MKSKFAVPVISLALVLIAVLTAFAFVSHAKTEKIRMNKGEVSFSNIVVDGNKMMVTIKAVKPSGMKILNTSYDFEDGVLKFKVFANKDVEIGEDDGMVHSVTVTMEAKGDIEEIKFLSVNDKGEEEEVNQTFKRGDLD